MLRWLIKKDGEKVLQYRDTKFYMSDWSDVPTTYETTRQTSEAICPSEEVFNKGREK